jgi:hypothetical protein
MNLYLNKSTLYKKIDFFLKILLVKFSIDYAYLIYIHRLYFFFWYTLIVFAMIDHDKIIGSIKDLIYPSVLLWSIEYLIEPIVLIWNLSILLIYHDRSDDLSILWIYHDQSDDLP